MQLTIDRLFESPDYYLFAIEGGSTTFLRMNRESYHRSIFIDGRIVPAAPNPLAVPLAPLLQYRAARGVTPARTGWIFHVAQCGSTLLARGLDRPGRNLVLREPLPLRQLGVARAGMAGTTGEWQAQLKLAACFAGRRYRADLPTIVKANVPVNFALDEIAALDPQAPAIFLYFPLAAYLLATLRSDGHRQWVRRVTGELAPALRPIAGDVTALGDGERVAALWLYQMRAFAAAMARLGNSFSLDAETLFDTPSPVLERSAELFGAPFEPAELDAMLGSALFATYSKDPAQAFDNDARRARQEETRRALQGELDAARQWLEPQLAGHPIPDRLPRPLAGAAPALFA